MTSTRKDIKKRSKSLDPRLVEALNKDAPKRSILKAVSGNTMEIPESFTMHDIDVSLNDENGGSGKLSKSKIRRRVSFANTASVRTYQESPVATPRRSPRFFSPTRASAAKIEKPLSPSKIPYLTNRSPTKSPSGILARNTTDTNDSSPEASMEVTELLPFNAPKLMNQTKEQNLNSSPSKRRPSISRSPGSILRSPSANRSPLVVKIKSPLRKMQKELPGSQYAEEESMEITEVIVQQAPSTKQASNEVKDMDVTSIFSQTSVKPFLQAPLSKILDDTAEMDFTTTVRKDFGKVVNTNGTDSTQNMDITYALPSGLLFSNKNANDTFQSPPAAEEDMDMTSVVPIRHTASTLNKQEDTVSMVMTCIVNNRKPQPEAASEKDDTASMDMTCIMPKKRKIEKVYNGEGADNMDMTYIPRRGNRLRNEDGVDMDMTYIGPRNPQLIENFYGDVSKNMTSISETEVSEIIGLQKSLNVEPKVSTILQEKSIIKKSEISNVSQPTQNLLSPQRLIAIDAPKERKNALVEKIQLMTPKSQRIIVSPERVSSIKRRIEKSVNPSPRKLIKLADYNIAMNENSPEHQKILSSQKKELFIKTRVKEYSSVLNSVSSEMESSNILDNIRGLYSFYERKIEKINMIKTKYRCLNLHELSEVKKRMKACKKKAFEAQEARDRVMMQLESEKKQRTNMELTLAKNRTRVNNRKGGNQDTSIKLSELQRLKSLNRLIQQLTQIRMVQENSDVIFIFQKELVARKVSGRLEYGLQSNANGDVIQQLFLEQINSQPNLRILENLKRSVRIWNLCRCLRYEVFYQQLVQPTKISMNGSGLLTESMISCPKQNAVLKLSQICNVESICSDFSLNSNIEFSVETITGLDYSSSITSMLREKLEANRVGYMKDIMKSISQIMITK